MPLPDLPDWQETRIGLHRAAQVIGGIRRAVAPEEPNWVHLGMLITPYGITTGPLPDLGAFELHFAERQIAHHLDEADQHRIRIDGHSQISLADAIDEYLASLGSKAHVDRYKVASSEAIRIEAGLAGDYARALLIVGDALARFRETLPGEKSRLVVWPHGFDAAFLWFATPNLSEQGPHMGIGFSPGSEGLDRPYVYLYVSPNPEGLTGVPLPAPARWFKGRWTGMVLDYDAFAQIDDPASAIVNTLTKTYEAVLPLLKLTSDA